MKLKMVRSSGNVFGDVGLPEDEAEHLKVRADLLIQIQERLKARGLTQTEAAKLLGVTQPRVSDLVRGRIDLFSVDSLIDMLARLGVRVKVVVTSPKKRRKRPTNPVHSKARDLLAHGELPAAWSCATTSGCRAPTWSRRMEPLPLARGEFRQAAHRMRRDAGNDVAQIVEGVDLQVFAGLHE